MSHIRIIQDGLCQLEVEKKKHVKNYVVGLLFLESDHFQKNGIGSQRKMRRITLIRHELLVAHFVFRLQNVMGHPCAYELKLFLCSIISYRPNHLSLPVMSLLYKRNK